MRRLGSYQKVSNKSFPQHSLLLFLCLSQRSFAKDRIISLLAPITACNPLSSLKAVKKRKKYFQYSFYLYVTVSDFIFYFRWFLALVF